MLRGLEEHPDMSREYNYQAIHDYLSWQYIPSHILRIKEFLNFTGALYGFDIASGDMKVEAYWEVDFSPHAKTTKLSFNNAKMQLRELLTNAVKRRLMSDVPYGAFLSGGLDSSIITGIMMQLCEHPVKAFTIGFNEPSYDERAYAEIVASLIITIHGILWNTTWKVIDPRNFDVLRKLVRHYGEPYSDASMLPTYYLSAFTVKMLLWH